jgi:hypothetical protein
MGQAEENSTTTNRWMDPMKKLHPDGNGNYTMQIITMMPVTGENFVTGTGTAKIRLNATETRNTYSNVTSVQIGSDSIGGISFPLNLTLSTLSIGVSVE